MGAAEEDGNNQNVNFVRRSVLLEYMFKCLDVHSSNLKFIMDFKKPSDSGRVSPNWIRWFEAAV